MTARQLVVVGASPEPLQVPPFALIPGSTAVQEVAFTMASAIASAEEALATGMQFDEFAPRFSFC